MGQTPATPSPPELQPLTASTETSSALGSYGRFDRAYPSNVTGPGWAIEHFDEPDDEWSACGIRSLDDLATRFVPNFFFGCEADDPFVSLAFDTRLNPNSVELSAMFGSDIGHWDVPVMNHVLLEAWEQVDSGRLSVSQLARFCHHNAREIYERPTRRSSPNSG